MQLNVAVDFPAELSEDTPRDALIKKIFGLPRGAQNRSLLSARPLTVGNLTYLTGYSGTGKSSLLREIAAKLQLPELKELDGLAEHSIIESFFGSFGGDLAEIIQWLGRFGLGEARVLTTKVKHLSAGQQERFRLAYIVWQKPKVLILDEFLASLDRVTARIIAYQFQRVVRDLNLTCFVATAHDDLKDALLPDTLVELDFEGGLEISHPQVFARVLPESREIVVSEGTIDDYLKLKPFHYMDQQSGDLDPQDVISIRKAEFRGKLVGVRVFTKLFPSAYESVRLFRKLNQAAVLSSRVIVHPVFRGLGISKRMDLAEADKRRFQKVFTHSALALYFPFDNSGGYRPLEHVSVIKTDAHHDYEKLLRTFGLPSSATLNDPRQSQLFWEGLSDEQQTQLGDLVIRILSDYDRRYTSYVCEHLGYPMPSSFEPQLLKFFIGLVRQTPKALFWKLLSEALHFPMLGMVKDLRTDAV